MDISVYQQISTQEKYQKIYATSTSSFKILEKKLWQFFKFLKIEPFSFCFVVAKPMNLSNEKWILVYFKKITQENISKDLREKDTHLYNIE